MAFSYRIITKITYVASSATAIYTHLTATYAHTYVRTVIIHNGNTTTELVKLYYVPSGSAAGTANEFYTESLVAGDTRILEFAPAGMILTDNGDFISGTTTTASKVTVQIFGGTD